jgi:hypothetical protein
MFGGTPAYVLVVPPPSTKDPFGSPRTDPVPAPPDRKSKLSRSLPVIGFDD